MMRVHNGLPSGRQARALIWRFRYVVQRIFTVYFLALSGFSRYVQPSFFPC